MRLQLAARSVHLSAFVTGVGGMLFNALVLVPITRRLGAPSARVLASWVARVDVLVALASVVLGLALRG